MKEYSMSKFQLIMMLGVGILGGVLYLVSALKGNYNNIYLFFPLIMFLMQVNFKPIKIFEEHLEFQIGPLTTLNSIKYSEIIKVKRHKENELYIYLKDNNKLKLPIKLVDEEDRDRIENFLKKTIC